jgi:hypothetical protein
VALSAVLIGGVTTIVMNANPLIPLDSYFALSDYLEVPNLRQRAFAHLAWLVKTKMLRLEVPMPPADEREQRIFLIYALLAAWYIGSIMLLIAGTVYGWLDRALGLAGGALFLLGLWLMARSGRSGLQTAVAAGASFAPGPRPGALRDRLLIGGRRAGCRGAHPGRSRDRALRRSAGAVAPAHRARQRAGGAGLCARGDTGRGRNAAAAGP